jgi:AraC family transcriptional regulator
VKAERLSYPDGSALSPLLSPRMLTPHADPWPRPEGFRVVSIATSLESPGTTYGPWLTDAYGMAWIVEGGGTTHYDDQLLHTGPGSVLCVRPGTMARHDWGSSRCFQAFVAFYADAFPAPWPKPETWPSLRQLQPDHVYFALFRALLGYDLKQESARACAVPLVELLLRVFVGGGQEREGQVVAVLPEAVERAMALIRSAVQAEPSQTLRLAALARSVHVTPQHLCRLFKESLGLGPIECAQALRLELAATWIERTEQSLQAVAERYGFSSPFHLSKVFKQTYGMSPNAYRKAFRQGLTARPPGLMFRNHPLRHYFYEERPGRILQPPESE